MDRTGLNENNLFSSANSSDSRLHGRGARRIFLRRVFSAAGLALFGRHLAAQSITTYLVRSGETLSEIALRHGLSVREIKELNHLESDTIYADQELRLAPAKDTYTRLEKVRAGIDEPKVTSSQWRHIILHHSATNYGNAAAFDRYHREERHMENGLAYHFVIGNGTSSGDGVVEIGGRWKNQLEGGHVASEAYNRTSIGICLVGNFEENKPSPLQLDAARQLISYLRLHVLEKQVQFLVHRDIEKTLCPGRLFPIQHFHEMFA